jgi:hypothetical protein
MEPQVPHRVRNSPQVFLNMFVNSCLSISGGIVKIKATPVTYKLANETKIQGNETYF